VISAWFYFLLTGVNVYVALVLGSKAAAAYRTPIELGGKMYPQTVAVAMYMVAALIFVILSARCARVGCARMDEDVQTEENTARDEWM
jgi:hypothetical protein